MKKTESGPQPTQQTVVTKELKIHNFISDVLMVTNDATANQNLPQEKKKTFLYEYLGAEKVFSQDILDEILMSRLAKNKDENKFIYLV